MLQFRWIFIVLTALSCSPDVQQNDHLNLEKKLSGKWNAMAFSGELIEEWKLGKDGFMIQESHYIERQDTSYSAHSKIEKVGNDVILFSVIKDSNPKIFKAERITDDEIVFQNSDYRNPYYVKYSFINQNNYQRSIMGYEGDSLTINTFKFERMR